MAEKKTQIGIEPENIVRFAKRLQKPFWANFRCYAFKNEQF